MFVLLMTFSIQIESAEVLVPMNHRGRYKGVEDTRKMKTRRIIDSLTRHMNDIRPPKVIPFSNRDEIVNGRVISQSEVKVTRIEPAAVSSDISSAEIANDILGNILGEGGLTSNATDLLRVLTTVNNERADSNETISTNSTTITEGFGFGDSPFDLVGAEAENNTDSAFENFRSIDKTLDVIVSLEISYVFKETKERKE